MWRVKNKLHKRVVAEERWYDMKGSSARKKAKRWWLFLCAVGRRRKHCILRGSPALTSCYIDIGTYKISGAGDEGVMMSNENEQR
jgi:hypothetical protein